MRWLVVAACVLASGCAHTIRKVSDCKEVEGEKRIECGACVAPNEAGGWLGSYEYRPDAEQGSRCTRVKK